MLIGYMRVSSAAAGTPAALQFAPANHDWMPLTANVLTAMDLLLLSVARMLWNGE